MAQLTRKWFFQGGLAFDRIGIWKCWFMAGNPKSNPGLVDGRRVQSPLRHPCSPKDMAKKENLKFPNCSNSKRAGEIHTRAVRALEVTCVLRVSPVRVYLTRSFVSRQNYGLLAILRRHKSAALWLVVNNYHKVADLKGNGPALSFFFKFQEQESNKKIRTSPASLLKPLAPAMTPFLFFLSLVFAILVNCFWYWNKEKELSLWQEMNDEQ